ncbi:hypothetical protein QA600_18610 [Natronococcus sp. A-GB1]|uniref:hypothetical protein n=1 Tax=Natronococcus sp. A-GB1 TaxID=3037648 RepID=UPI00241E643A|nr:hypothetical protein [Natronococcus sp. A-GB1]MDG5761346.1 hypothetical protein [Natronococcus sp. A-GB1]
MPDDRLSYSTDIRNEDPTSDHQGAFKRGWRDADKGEEYIEDMHEELTWHNLGWRLGVLFGETSDELKQELFEWCKAQQNKR